MRFENYCFVQLEQRVPKRLHPLQVAWDPRCLETVGELLAPPQWTVALAECCVTVMASDVHQTVTVPVSL